MTDRIRTLTVTLDDDYRDEHESIGVIIHAIRMVKGVADVTKGGAVDMADHIARDDYRLKVGSAISELALGRDNEFIADVQAAIAKLKARRGY